MAIFKYRFQSILKYKIQLENSAKNELAKAFAILNQELGRLGVLNEQLLRWMEEFRQKSERNTIAKLKEVISYIEYLEQRIEAQKNIVNQARENVDIHKRKVIEANRAREVFEKLKEKKHEEFLLEERRAEQRIVDEIVSYKENSSKKEDKDSL